ncbi:MAG: hypothetical protein C4320_09470 [Armatimonadota bacterium]
MNKNFFLLPLLLFSSLANAQVDPAKTVATVNGEEIKGAEYYRRMEYLPGVGKNFSRVFTELPPGLLALDQIITDKIVLLLAREKGVVPSELEVTKEIERRSAADATYAKKWNESGRTADELREVVKLELAQYKLQTFGVTITDQEVTQYYTANPERSTIPKAIKLRVIAVNSKAEQAAVDEHLDNCPRCRLQAEEAKRIVLLLGGSTQSCQRRPSQPICAFRSAPLSKGRRRVGSKVRRKGGRFSLSSTPMTCFHRSGSRLMPT